ncbi:putative DNA repair protein rad5 [Rosellinia necatrix]|uniref:Putative DNA repair protein rad5 n=1 Tax=Rosellinia necatrix TaxID=77044 RepID=A0A1W2TH89_ROSNE|nr:putative DNA repair protein rad5 [Rosellinia necatrix]
MNPADSGEPPAKKRRFFVDPDDRPDDRPDDHTDLVDVSGVGRGASSDDVPRGHLERDTGHSGLEPSTCSPPSVPASSTLATSATATATAATSASTSVHTPSQPSVGSDADVAFDRDAFQSLVGDTVDPDTLAIICERCGGSLERAVNMYFDGTWKSYQRRPCPQPHPLMRPAIRPSLNPTPVAIRSPAEIGPAVHTDPPQDHLDSRYIGAFGAEGWATRSGTNLIKHGDVVKIERQKVQQTPLRMRLAASGKSDVMVRFTDSNGTEVGRLAKDAASWISSLIDQDVCKFEGSCVYAPERLRTNDTIFLQLRCFLRTSVFHTRGFGSPDNRSTGLYEEKESVEERNLRLRQVAIVKLFQEINLTPTKTNAASAHNARQGLLDAAELAEKKTKLHQSNGRDASGSQSDDDEDGEELEQDQLDALYRKAQSFDFNTPEAEPAETFAMNLRPYQKQSLHWMLAKERDEKDESRETSMHPLWEEYAWPLKDVDDKELGQVEGQANFYVNPYSGEMSLQFPYQEQHCLGGILADEMGLGKTIQMLSLIHSHKSGIVAHRTSQRAPAIDGTLKALQRSPNSQVIVSAPKTTLVIAPMSLLAQWQNEAENASKEGTLRSIVYYGNEKADNLQALCRMPNLASAPDIVITSYGVVLSEFSQINSRPGGRELHKGLFSLNFFRIILDEAHSIKNRQSKTAKACYELSAEHRWVLTGTPIVNRLEDLFSLVRFLRVEPWNNFSFWRTFITAPFESKNFMRALDVVQTVLEPLVMRRTKDMKTPTGEPLIALPAKSIEIVDIELSQAERAVYDYVFAKAKRTFSANIERGTVMKAYTTIFAQILRLRQTCCHPTLVRNRDIVTEEELAGAEADAAAGLSDDMDLQSLIEQFTATTGDEKEVNTFGAHVLEQIRDEAVNECPICSEEPMIDQTVTGCWHSACRKCLLDYMKHHTDRHEVPRCFNCRKPLNSRDIFQVVRHDDDIEAFQSAPKISLQRLGVNESSSKVVTLMQHLRQLRREHPRMKSVVFSQFTSFMSLIEPALAKANMKFLRLDGTINQKARATVLKAFAECEKFTILLISLRAGGVGLNLTQAKRVYMMDPWWSFAVEAQAIDRVHRMGQDAEVKVYRFICKDSVEERMLKVQDRKKFIATSLGMMTDEEKRLQRIEDIKELLS